MLPITYLRTYAMGCDFEVFAFSEDERRARTAAECAIEEILRVESLLSHYLHNSEISYLNLQAAKAPTPVHPEVFDLLKEALHLCRETEGAFDVTVMPLVKCWGLYQGRGRIPSPRVLARALSRVGYRHVRLDPTAQTVVFAEEGVELHLGAIGKGYAVDRAIECLQEAGVEAAMVHGGHSSVRAYGCLTEGRGWQIRLPHPMHPQRSLAQLMLHNQAISTSAATYQYFERDGKRYGHILDPRSGLPVDNEILQVSVLAPRATLSDALSTAFFVMGEAQTRLFLQHKTDIRVGLLRKGEDQIVWLGSMEPVG